MFNALLIMPDWFWLITAGGLGAILGSYVNMASYRLPRGISTVTRTRSFCPSCKNQLAWWENIPILSYLFLLGRCRRCKAGIGVRYLAVELFVAALFVLSAHQFVVLNGYVHNTGAWKMHPAVFVAQLFLIVDLALLSVVDLEAWLIPIETTLWPWVPLAMLLAPIFPDMHAAATAWTGSSRWDALIDSFTGLVLGAGLLWTIGFLTTFVSYFYFKLSRRNERPREGMGLGDCHLLGMVGALLGWKIVCGTLFLGVMIGSITGVGKILWEKYRRRRLGDQYKPWQPTYELPPDEPALLQPRYWLLAAMGIAVLVVAGILFERSSLTFQYEIVNTLEENKLGVSFYNLGQRTFDTRKIPVILMAFIGVLLVFAAVFLKYLALIDMLPQGSIVEKPGGEKEEVLQGNYVPFGPSLAAAALLAVFFDPLIRNFAFWFALGGQGPVAPPAYHVLAEKFVMDTLVAGATKFNEFTRWLVGG